MSRAPEVIVVGLGAMGSAALRELARRGCRVRGFDRFAPPHALGSSHGDSRIIREAYFEDPRYVPLVQRAYALWEELQRESGRPLVTPTGGLMIGPRDGVLVSGAIASAEAHRLPWELLDAAQIRRRHPAFRVEHDRVGVWEPRAGFLRPEAAIAAFLDGARAHGAEVHLDEPAHAWEAGGAGVAVATARGSYRADRVVLAAGAWLPRLVPELPLSIERVVAYWFETVEGSAALDAIPVYIWEHERGRFFYGFPRSDKGVKVARHHEGEPADPDRPRRAVSRDEVDSMRAVLGRCIPSAGGRLLESAVCMYTNTPDGHFVVDLHPRHPQVVVVSACSGHGFKFAPVIGEAVADLIVEGRTRWDLDLFRIGRFTRRAC